MKKIINWFKGLELYQIFVGIFLGFAVLILIMIPFEIYKESITHYDITVAYFNGATEKIHCSFFQERDDYLIYYIDGYSYRINKAAVLKYNVESLECNCDE